MCDISSEHVFYITSTDLLFGSFFVDQTYKKVFVLGVLRGMGASLSVSAEKQQT